MRLLIISCIPEFGAAASQTLEKAVEAALTKAAVAAAARKSTATASAAAVEVCSLCGPSVSKARILPELKRLAEYAAGGPGRRAIVFYTGHGDQMADRSGDEADGRDEFWRVPSGPPVIDDDISRVFASTPTHPESLVLLISDSCSSGTMIDRALMPAKSAWATIAACRDSESALSTSDGGAFTLFGLIPALQNPNVKTVGELFECSASKLSFGDQHVTVNYSAPEIKNWLIFE